jgi:hypothetical protein
MYWYAKLLKAEQSRLDLQHTMITLALDGRLTAVPMIEAPNFVMDVGKFGGLGSVPFLSSSWYERGTKVSSLKSLQVVLPPRKHPLIIPGKFSVKIKSDLIFD